MASMSLCIILCHKNEQTWEKTELLCEKWTASVCVILPMFVTMHLTLKGTISIPDLSGKSNGGSFGILA
jgi:hypothetical protein